MSKSTNYFKMKKPCANCPFLKVGAIDLAEGRVEGIIQELLADDNEHFLCHKTVHGKKGGSWEETEDGWGEYQRSGHESGCYGSMVYLMKMGRPNIPMRVGFAMGLLNPSLLQLQDDDVIDPPLDARESPTTDADAPRARG